MAKKTDEESQPAQTAAEPASSDSPVFLIVAILNTLVILGAVGAAVYTRLIYQRPTYTEDSERIRLAKTQFKVVNENTEPGLVQFDPISVNIKSIPSDIKPADGTPQQVKGKFHYATVAFALELRNIQKKDRLDQVKPALLDQILSLIGRKDFHELTTVQGRYLLRTQILDIANALLATSESEHEGLVTNVFFTQFVVQ